MGEKLDDLRVFDIEKYIYGLFKDLGWFKWKWIRKYT
jgi:hypothetical protein